MIVFWYLVRLYLKIFSGVFTVFIGILLTTRLPYILHFFSSYSSIYSISLFLFYQISHIFPIALSLSTFTSSFLLMKKLQDDREFFALRSSGVSIAFLFYPVIWIACLFSLVCFGAVETASYAKTAGREILFQEAKNYPLSLLNEQKFLPFTLLYEKTFKDKEKKTWIFGKMGNEHLFFEGEFATNEEQFLGKNVTVLSHRHAKTFPEIDLSFHKSLEGSLENICLIKSPFKEKPNSMAFSTLIKKAHRENLSFFHEILRRISLSFSPLSCAILGLFLSRRKRLFPSIQASLVLLVFFSCYFLGKNMKHFPSLSTCFFLLNHLSVALYALSFRLKKESYENLV